MRNLSVATLFFILALTVWAQQAQAPVEITAEPSHHLVLDNMFVRVFAVSVDPGKSTLMHRHGHDYVVVPLITGKLKIDDGKQEHIADLKAGGSYARPIGVEHNVINANDFEYAFVEIEIKA